jgi:hypothetical protein
MEVVTPSLGGAVVIKPAGKDSRWLTLEVCREFARANCPRSAEECKYAHPPPHVEIQNGRVTCCYDSIKGKCQRNNPPCKYLHPPGHLQEQLLQTGKQNLAMKNLQAAQAVAVAGFPPMLQMAGSNPAAVYPILYSDALKLQSAYQTMVFPSQYPYMAMNQQILSGSNMGAAAAAVSPYQLYASLAQPASLPPAGNPYIQLLDHVTGAAPQPSAQSAFTAVSLSGPVGNNTQLYSMANTSQLDVWNAMNSTYSYHNTMPDDQAVKQALSTAAASSTKVYAAVQHATSSSPIVYQQPPPPLTATSADQLQTASARKRPHTASDDMLLGMHAVGAPGIMPANIKRPALVDNITGLPVYQPLPSNVNPYQQLLPLQTPQPRYVALGSVAGCPNMIQPF